MILGFKDQAGVVRRCVDTLTDPSPACILLVLPPGFGENEVAAQIKAGLSSHPTQPRVALVSPDTCGSTDHYVDELHHQWGERDPLPAPPERRYASDRLRDLIGSLPGDRVAIQIIVHFQSMLGGHITKEVLARLHTAEEDRLVRTLNIAPCSYDDLRTRWRAQGHHLCTSAYGYAHVQEGRIAPLDPPAAIAQAVARQVPDHLAERFVAWSGAYPGPFERLWREWKYRGMPPLDSAHSQEFWQTAKDSLTDFLKWIDPEDEPHIVMHLATLGYGTASAEILSALDSHRWRQTLLGGRTLRAACLAEAALDHLARRRNRAGRATLREVPRLARQLYRQREFAAADRLLRHLDDAALSPSLRTLKAGAAFMALLCGNGEETFHMDADWKRLRPALAVVRASFAAVGLGPSAREQLASHLDHVGSVVDAVNLALKVNTRVGDVLFGLHAGATEVARPPVALLLIYARFEAARRIVGDTRACVLGLPLPEQIFRAWAFLALDINFYYAPETDQAAWNLLLEHGNEYYSGPVAPPVPSKPFPSFDLFSRYTLALHLGRHPDADGLRPEASMKTLNRSLSQMAHPRHANAHAFAFAEARERENYFNIIARWMQSLIAVCPGGPTMESLHEQLRPLPFLSEEGSLVWLSEQTTNHS